MRLIPRAPTRTEFKVFGNIKSRSSSRIRISGIFIQLIYILHTFHYGKRPSFLSSNSKRYARSMEISHDFKRVYKTPNLILKCWWSYNQLIKKLLEKLQNGSMKVIRRTEKIVNETCSVWLKKAYLYLKFFDKTKLLLLWNGRLW